MNPFLTFLLSTLLILFILWMNNTNTTLLYPSILCFFHSKLFTPELEALVIDTYLDSTNNNNHDYKSLLTSKSFMKWIIQTCMITCSPKGIDSKGRLFRGLEEIALLHYLDSNPKIKLHKLELLQQGLDILKTIQPSTEIAANNNKHIKSTTMQGCYAMGALAFKMDSTQDLYLSLSHTILHIFKSMRLTTTNNNNENNSEEYVLYACGMTSILRFAFRTGFEEKISSSTRDTAILAIGNIARHVQHAIFLLEIESVDYLAQSLVILNSQQHDSRLATLHVKSIARVFQNIKHYQALLAVKNTMRKYIDVPALQESGCSALGVVSFRDEKFQYQMRFGEVRVTGLLTDVMKIHQTHYGILTAASGVLWTIWTIPTLVNGDEEQDDIMETIQVLTQIISSMSMKMVDEDGLPHLIENVFGALFMLSLNAIPAYFKITSTTPSVTTSNSNTPSSSSSSLSTNNEKLLYQHIALEMIRLLSSSTTIRDILTPTTCAVACDYMIKFNLVQHHFELQFNSQELISGVEQILTKYNENKEIQEKCGQVRRIRVLLQKQEQEQQQQQQEQKEFI
jgi:hypothetical protein